MKKIFEQEGYQYEEESVEDVEQLLSKPSKRKEDSESRQRK